MKSNLIDTTSGVLLGTAVAGFTASLFRDVVAPLMALSSPAWAAFGGAALNCALVTGVVTAALAAFRKVVPPPAPDTKACRYCLSEIPALASRCRHCTSVLADLDAVAGEPEREARVA